MKYTYDKSALKGLSVKPFLNLTKTRDQAIEKGDTSIPSSWTNANELARQLHPAVQYGLIQGIEELPGAKRYTIVADKNRGTQKLAFFRAGQYISVENVIEGAKIWRPYSISSDPSDALKNPSSYELVIKETANGFVSNYILEHWQVGDQLTLSGPQGEFYYTVLRDAPNVLALAGGSGITPFLSMARAIVSGQEDFHLTILYGSRTKEAILMGNELEQLAEKSGGKVKIVPVLSDEQREGYEHGFINAELIRKYMPAEDTSIFVCGPKAMYAFAESEVAKLNIPRRRYREELAGEYGNPFVHPDYPADKVKKEYKFTVLVRDKQIDTVCRNDESLLVALERAGIAAPNHCRSGSCGFCHSLLKEGKVFVPAERGGRRMADEKFGWIHPCVSYPLSDIVLEVPVAE